MISDPAEPRELLGRIVRGVWIRWAREQADPKPSWLLGWDELDAGQQEVDMRIGLELFECGKRAGIEIGKAEGSWPDRARAGGGAS